MHKTFHHALRGLAAALWLVVGITTSNAQTLTASYGTGASVSYLTFEATAFGPTPLVFAYHYDYDPGNPLDGHALLTAIFDADSLLSGSFMNYGNETEPSYFLNSVTYNGITLTNTPAPDYQPYWAQWVSGGSAGYPEAEPILSGVWDYGSGASWPYRLIAPGSWDGYVFDAGFTPPSASPVPEPSTLVLVAVGTLHLLRRKRHARPSLHLG